MNELHSILDAWIAHGDQAQSGVLVTVVHVTGSAYRRPGARMLILSDGRRIGSISGGCLEGDISKKAWWLTEDGRPTVRVYDTTSDDDAVWEFGLGCNGVIHVMLERLDLDTTTAAMQFLQRCRESRQEAVMATVIDSARPGVSVGDRWFLDASGASGGALRGSPVEAELRPHAAGCLGRHKSCLAHLRDCQVFVEWIGPPPSLVVFGAGHDAVPLVSLAKNLGWHVTVADGRPAYARPDRFPAADRVVRLHPQDLLAGLDIGPETLVVMMTHNYPQDARLLRRILPRRPRYLGLLGPSKRTERLFAEIGTGVPAPGVYAPVGLDIGSDTPEIIALSIIAEVQAVLAGREGGLLRNRRSSIHSPVEEAGEASSCLTGTLATLASCDAMVGTNG